MISRLLCKLDYKFYIFLIIVIHLGFINNYPISVEFSFIEMAKFFEDFNKLILYEFLDIQANTVVYSLFIYILDKILLINNYHYSGKILSILSYFIIYFGIKNLNKFFNINENKLILFTSLLIFLNPIIWIYGFKITSDLLPAATGFYSLSVLFDKKINLQKIIFSSFILSLTILLKPMFAILFVFFVIYITFFTPQIQTKNVILYNCISFFFSFIPILTYGYILNKFNIVISSYSNDYINSFLNFNFFNFTTSFLYQVGILGIFCLPIIVNSLNIFFLKIKNILAIIIFFILGYFNTYFPGELDLGTFFIFDKNFLKGSYFACSYIFIYSLYISFKNTGRDQKKIYFVCLLSVFLYIFILSFFRPAQRYLMLFIPIIYYFYFISTPGINFFFQKLVILIFICINFVLTTYSYNKSTIAKDIINYLEINKIISNTTPGPISDSYNFIKFKDIKKKYLITKNKQLNYIEKFKSGYFFMEINYYLIMIK